MNIASAAASPANLLPVAGVPAAGAPGTSQGSGSQTQTSAVAGGLDAFIALLAGFAAQCTANGDEGCDVPQSIAVLHKKEDKKDCLNLLSTPIQIPQDSTPKQFILGLALTAVSTTLNGSGLDLRVADQARGGQEKSQADNQTLSPAVAAFASSNSLIGQIPVVVSTSEAQSSRSSLTPVAPVNAATDVAVRNLATASSLGGSVDVRSSQDRPLPPHVEVTRNGETPTPANLAFALRLEESNIQQSSNAPAQTQETTGSTVRPGVDVHAALHQSGVEALSSARAGAAAERDMTPVQPVAPHRVPVADGNAARPGHETHDDSRDQHPGSSSEEAGRKQSQATKTSTGDDIPAAGENAGAPLPHAVPVVLRSTTEQASSADVHAPSTRTETQPPQAKQTDAVAESRPQPQTSPMRELSMRVSAAESPAVDIKLVDRGGSVRVAVRTPDADLARNLQSGLNDLVHRLERKGFDTETWSSGDTSSTLSTRQAAANGNDSLSQHNSRDPREGMQDGGGSRQGNGRNRPKWVEELEQKLANPDS